MENKEATELIGVFAEKQSEGHYPCPRCGTDAMDEIPSRNALSRCIDIYICDTCGIDEALRAFAGEQKQSSEWAITQAPQNYGMLHTYYYTFGSDPNFPYQNGWIEVWATSWEEAHKKFRLNFPDRHPGILNCSFFYEEDKWTQMDPPNNWHGYQCYGIIC